jgi:hypothetical protein
LLSNIPAVDCRQGVADAVNRKGYSDLSHFQCEEIVDRLGMTILPFAAFLLVPILGSLNDPDSAVRKTTAHCFAKLVKIIPLEVAMSCP